MMAGLADEGGRRPVRFRLWSGKLAVVQEDTSVCASEIHMHTIARIIPLSDDRSLLARMLARSTFPRGVSCSIFPRGVSLFPPCSVSLLPPCPASSLPCFLAVMRAWPCLVSFTPCFLHAWFHRCHARLAMRPRCQHHTAQAVGRSDRCAYASKCRV